MIGLRPLIEEDDNVVEEFWRMMKFEEGKKMRENWDEMMRMLKEKAERKRESWLIEWKVKTKKGEKNRKEEQAKNKTVEVLMEMEKKEQKGKLVKKGGKEGSE